MQEPILITGKQSPFTDDLVQALLNRHLQIFATSDAEDDLPEVPDSVGSGLCYVPWSRRSLLSARSMLLSVDRDTNGFSRAIVVCSPEGINTPLHQTESALLERTVDAALKGYLFVLKEIIAYFVRYGYGDLTVIWYDGGAEVLPPFDAALAGSIQGLIRSLFTFCEDDPVLIRGLQASDSDSRSVVLWAVEQIFDKADKSAGRWQKYGQRSTFLPFRKA